MSIFLLIASIFVLNRKVTILQIVGGCFQVIGAVLLLLNTSDNLQMIAYDIVCAVCFAAAALFLESLELTHGVSFYSGANLMHLSCGICSASLLTILWLLDIYTTNDPQGT